MTHTTNYNFNLPAGTDPAAVGPLNQNFELIDRYIKANLNNIAEDYDSSKTYNTDNIVAHDNGIYKCLDDNVTGTWDSAKWEATTLGKEVGQGGGSSVEVNPSGDQDEVLDGLEVDGVNYGLDVVGEVSGLPAEIATFNDGADAPLYECVVEIEAVQEGSGDPYPAGGSAQKWDEQWEVGAYNTSTGEKSASTTKIRCKNPIPVNASTTYYALTNGYGMRVFYYDSNNSFIDSPSAITNTTFTTPSNCAYITFHMADTYGTTYGGNLGINYPSSDTTYHKYSNIRPISGWDSVEIGVDGQNLLPENWYQGFISTNDGKSISSNDYWVYSEYVKIGNQSINFNANENNRSLIFRYDKNFTFLGANQVIQGNKAVAIADNTAYYVRISYNVNGASEQITPQSVLSKEPQINLGINTLPFEPYKGITRTVDFGQDVYGGAADLLNGILPENQLMEVFDDTATVTFGRDGQTNWYYVITSGQSANVAGLPQSNQYTGAEVSNSNDNLGIQKLPNGYVRIRVGGTQPANTDAFIAALGVEPLQVLTPITGGAELTFEPIPTTNTLEGVNNIYADCGNIDELGYFKDGKLTRSVKAIVEAMTGNANTILAEAIGEE